MDDHSPSVQSNPLPSSPRSPHIITIRDVPRQRGSRDLSSKTGLYRPLGKGEIRLLTVFPGKMGTKMCCSLKTVTLKEKRIPEYEALSYVWGEPQLSRLIWVGDKILPVTKNLDAALENLRYLDKPRTLWIDAICINQSDLDERSQQVLLMKNIYRDASQVLIWLGLQDQDSDLAFDLLESVYRLDDTFVESVRKRQGWAITADELLFQLGPRRASSGAEFTLNNLQPHHLSALKNTFSRRSWWKRIWIIQEAVYAKAVVIVCGQRSISWELLEKLTKSDDIRSAETQTAQLASSMETAIIIATLRNTLASTTQETIHNTGSWFNHSNRMLEIVTGRRRRRFTRSVLDPEVIESIKPLERPFKTTLDSLMVVFETSACTDPRDRIYGLLSLIDNPKLEILPDYTKSPYTIFEEATRSIISQYLSLDLLAYVHRSAQSNMSTKEPGQSSWVPDFAAPRQYSTLISSSAPRPLYHSSRGYDLDRKLLSTSTSFLSIRTIDCDLVEEVLRTVNISDPDWKAWFREWEPPGITPFVDTLSYWNNKDTYWRTLMLDITRPVGWPTRITGADLIIYRHLFANWSTSRRAPLLRDKLNSPANLALYEKTRASNSTIVEDFDDILGDHLHGWSLCRTSGGKLGWVPNVARAGDTIHVAGVSSLPLILRRKGGTYQLVGTAYVHGIMDGEIVEWQGSRSRFDGGDEPGILKSRRICLT